MKQAQSEPLGTVTMGWGDSPVDKVFAAQA